jgi:hypothetical protein
MLRRNVLVIHEGALGDFVVAFPILMACGRVFPQSRVICATSGSKGRLAEYLLGLEFVDSSTGGWHALHAADLEPPSAVVDLLRRCHTVVAFSQDLQSVALTRARVISAGAEVIPIVPRPESGWTESIGDWLVRQLRSNAALHQGAQQMLQSIRTRGLGRSLERRFDVLLHPGSGGAKKCWSLDRFAEVARRLRHEGKRIGFVIGEVELDRWPSSERALLAQEFPLIVPEDLVKLAQLFCSTRVAIVNDSGPGHLAAAVGCGVVSIFGPSDPRVWAPIGPAVKIIHGDLEQIDVGTVHDAAAGMLQSRARV